MGSTSWAVPVGVLGAIVVVGFLFVWWWFPRAWNRGVTKDQEEVNMVSGEEREEQRRANRAIIERFARARAMERGEIVEDTSDAPPPPYKPTDNVHMDAAEVAR